VFICLDEGNEMRPVIQRLQSRAGLFKHGEH
jgi:hypothetical protein